MALLRITDVIECQTKWGKAITHVSKQYLNKQDFVAAASDALSELYAYECDEVLFKPTKANTIRFRPTKQGALSYFVGCQNVSDGFVEDNGFAINGGNCWADVAFDNHKIYLNGNTAIAMGVYHFVCATTKETTTVEYTIGYKRYKDGNVRIFLHHSSLPFTNTVTCTESFSDAYSDTYSDLS